MKWEKGKQTLINLGVNFKRRKTTESVILMKHWNWNIARYLFILFKKKEIKVIYLGGFIYSSQIIKATSCFDNALFYAFECCYTEILLNSKFEFHQSEIKNVYRKGLNHFGVLSQQFQKVSLGHPYSHSLLLYLSFSLQVHKVASWEWFLSFT